MPESEPESDSDSEADEGEATKGDLGERLSVLYEGEKALDPHRRERLRAKWCGRNKNWLDKVEEIDEAMIETWAKEAKENWWNLNCLYYAGTKLATEFRPRKSPAGGEPET